MFLKALCGIGNRAGAGPKDRRAYCWHFWIAIPGLSKTRLAIASALAKHDPSGRARELLFRIMPYPAFAAGNLRMSGVTRNEVMRLRFLRNT